MKVVRDTLNHGLKIMKVVRDTVNHGLKKDLSNDTDEMMTAFVSCHVFFKFTEKRFRHFEDINKIWPGCGEKVHEFMKAEPKMSSDEDLVMLC